MHEILFVCQCSYLNSAKHNSPLASQKPKRVASMMVRKFSVSPEKWIHFEMRDSYKIPELKKSYELSFFTREKSLCEFHFRRFTLPGTSGESSTFTFITSHWIHLERKKNTLRYTCFARREALHVRFIRFFSTLFVLLNQNDWNNPPAFFDMEPTMTVQMRNLNFIVFILQYFI